METDNIMLSILLLREKLSDIISDFTQTRDANIEERQICSYTAHASFAFKTGNDGTTWDMTSYG